MGIIYRDPRIIFNEILKKIASYLMIFIIIKIFIIRAFILLDMNIERSH